MFLASMVNPPFFNSELDRFWVSVCVAISIHTLIILSVGSLFYQPSPHPDLRPIEIILAPNDSGGERKQGENLQPSNIAAVGKDKESKIPQIEALPSKTEVAPPQSKRVKPPEHSTVPIVETPPVVLQASSPETEKQESETTAIAAAPPSAMALISNAMALAKRAAPVSRSQAERKSRIKRIARSPKEPNDAAYRNALLDKIDRVAGLQSPEDAGQRRLSGSVTLDIGLDYEGKLIWNHVIKSSGYSILDDAAIHIVELASPYAPFPENIRKNFDSLYFDFKLMFQHEQGISSK